MNPGKCWIFLAFTFFGENAMKNSDERGDYFLNQFKTSIFEFDSEFDVEFDIFLMKINFFLFFY